MIHQKIQTKHLQKTTLVLSQIVLGLVCLFIVGPSASGKTAALYSMVSKRKIQGKRDSYRKVFDKIYIMSPAMANGSMKQDPFKDIPKNQVYRKLTIEGLEELEERIRREN